MEVDIQVLQVATGERNVSDNLNLAIARLGNQDIVTEVTDTSLDLDAVVQEFLESGDIEDLVAGRLRGVDDELFLESVSLPMKYNLKRRRKVHTFWVTF